MSETTNTPPATPSAQPAAGDTAFSQELPEDFFAQQKNDEEDSFKNDFDTAYTHADEVGGFETSTPPATPPATPQVDEQGKVTPEVDAEGNPITPTEPEPFKFDESLAEEEAKELAELNAKLGTNFESREALNKAMNKSDNVEKKAEVDEARSHVQYFEKMKAYDDKKLVTEDKKLLAQQKGQDINDPDVMELINEEIATLEASGMIAYAATAVRTNLQGIIDTKQKVVTDFDTSQQETAEQAAAAKKEGLQGAVNDLFKQKTFMGIQLKEQDLMDVYKDVSKDKHIAHLKANPLDAIKFGIFKKYESQITTILNKPSFKDGVQVALQEIGLAKPGEPVNPAVASTGSPTETASYLESLLK